MGSRLCFFFIFLLFFAGGCIRVGRSANRFPVEGGNHAALRAIKDQNRARIKDPSVQSPQAEFDHIYVEFDRILEIAASRGSATWVRWGGGAEDARISSRKWVGYVLWRGIALSRLGAAVTELSMVKI